jgi:hypothetical protein
MLRSLIVFVILSVCACQEVPESDMISTSYDREMFRRKIRFCKTEENFQIENVMSVRKQKFIDVKNRLSKNAIKPRGHTTTLSGLGEAACPLRSTMGSQSSQDRWERDSVFHTKKYISRCTSS